MDVAPVPYRLSREKIARNEFGDDVETCPDGVSMVLGSSEKHIRRHTPMTVPVVAAMMPHAGRKRKAMTRLRSRPHTGSCMG